MYLFLTILIVIIAVLLTLLVLAQNSKGGGLAAGFSSPNQVFGVRKATDIFEKATWGFTASIIVLAIVAASISPYRSSSINRSQSAVQDVLQHHQPQDVAIPGFGEEFID